MTVAQRLADAGIEVKPLAWAKVRLANFTTAWTADRYTVQPLANGQWAVNNNSARFRTRADAFGWSHADYTARILSALQKVKP